MSGAEAAELWASDATTRWQQAMDGYRGVVVAQRIDGLEELDRWYLQDLPGELRVSSPPELPLAALLAVVRWKMKRGEWRPRNLALAQGNADALVRSRTRAAFGLVPDPRKPLAEIGALAGVGPATASAVLAAYRPDLYPFLDELVGAAIPGLGKPAFTVGYYLKYAQALRERTAALGKNWTPQQVSLALWSASGGKSALHGIT